MNIVSARLKLALQRDGRAVEEIASRAGVGRRTVYHYLEGSRDPSTKRLARLASELGVTVGWLLGENEEIQLHEEGEP